MNTNNPNNNQIPYLSPKRGENLFIYLLSVIALLLLGGNLYLVLKRSKRKEAYHHVTVKFVGGNKTKLVLNAEQYEQLKATLNQPDGYFEIKDEQNSVKLYREHVCAVEVKKR